MAMILGAIGGAFALIGIVKSVHSVLDENIWKNVNTIATYLTQGIVFCRMELQGN